MMAGRRERPDGVGQSPSTSRRAFEWLLLGSLSIGFLLWPAVYNRFPIVFYDTGAYIAAPRLGELAPGRGVAYGIFLAAFQGDMDWWPALVAQAAVSVWLIHLMSRVHRLPNGPRSLVLTVAILAIVGSLPWFTAQLMPDAFAASVILILYLLGFRADRLAPWERGVLAPLGVFAIAVHMSHVALACALLLVIAVSASMKRVSVALPALVVALALIAVPLANAIVTGRPAFTPGGQTFIFGRLVQDGIVSRFLADHCPSPSYRLCAYKDALPKTADEWIWGQGSPFDDIGAWDEGADEMRRITIESLRDFPLEHLRRAADASWSQFWSFRTGDGLDQNDYWDNESVIDNFYPELRAEYAAARQQAVGLSFSWINRLQLPVAFASLAVCAAALVRARLRRQVELADLCGFVIVALLANAVICGVLSNPHARYQSRIVWLAPLCAIVAAQHVFSRDASRRPTT